VCPLSCPAVPAGLLRNEVAGLKGRGRLTRLPKGSDDTLLLLQLLLLVLSLGAWGFTPVTPPLLSGLPALLLCSVKPEETCPCMSPLLSAVLLLLLLLLLLLKSAL